MTHKNECSVQVSAIFLLELLVMLIGELHIGGPECCLFVSGGYLWFECLNSLVNSMGCSEFIHTRTVTSLLLLLSDQVGKARFEDSNKPVVSSASAVNKQPRLSSTHCSLSETGCGSSLPGILFGETRNLSRGG
jgi:hypothetical protein